jgi:SdpI/YfhL protein family
MSPNIVILIAYLSVALLLAALGHPLAQRKVARNGFYGFRSPATLSDDAVWYEVNARAGRELRTFGLLLIPVTLATAWMPLMVYLAVCNAVLLVPLSFIVVRNWKLAKRLLESREDG